MHESSRLRSLDGLRGIAAFAVLLGHLAIVDPWFYGALSASQMPGGGVKRLIFYSPIHIFLAGTEAVMVFFVLSGFVLTLAFSERQSTQMSYLIPRLTRLYPPIWGALVFALLLSSLRPIGKLTYGSEWHASHISVTNFQTLQERAEDFFRDLFVLSGTSWLNSSLWSMRVELLVSTFLIVVLILTRWGVVGFLASVVLALGAVNVANFGDVLRYLPYFVVGGLLAKSKWRPNRKSSDLLLAAGVLSFTIPWMARALDFELSSGILSEIFYLIGASATVASALSEHGFGKLLGRKLFQYLGSRSYSLYLIHAPIVTLVGFWCMRIAGDVKYWPLWAPWALVASLVLAELFYRAIELPSHRLAIALKARMRNSTHP